MRRSPSTKDGVSGVLHRSSCELQAQHIVEPRAIAHLDKRGTDYAPPADALRSNKAAVRDDLSPLPTHTRT